VSPCSVSPGPCALQLHSSFHFLVPICVCSVFGVCTPVCSYSTLQGNWKSGQRSGPGTKLCLRNLSVRLAPPSSGHAAGDGRSASALLASTLLPPVNCGTGAHTSLHSLQLELYSSALVLVPWSCIVPLSFVRSLIVFISLSKCERPSSASRLRQPRGCRLGTRYRAQSSAAVIQRRPALHRRGSWGFHRNAYLYVLTC
jgi:hypothetical protein